MWSISCSSAWASRSSRALTRTFAGGVEALDDDERVAGEVAAIAGDREAALLDLALAAALDELGVDEGEGGLLGHAEDDDAQRDADLRRGEADAAGGVHALDHVVDER